MEKVKNQSFPLKTIDDWEEKATLALKGKTVDSLQTATYESIILKPLYSRNDKVQPVSEFPGGADYRRGISPLGYRTNDWRTAQRISYQTTKELQEKLHQSFEKGQSAISFKVEKGLFEEEILAHILGDFYQEYPFAINARDLQTSFLTALAQIEEHEQVSGYIGADPLALFVEAGLISEEYFNDWADSIQQANRKYPNLRTVLIDTVPYHNGGANTIQELGIAIATGVNYLEKLQETGMYVEEILTKMVFQFSVGGNYFMEIAKLRAARVLWSRVTELYAVKEEKRGMVIAAETSSFTKTIHDPHVNLLRAGNEAFAAVIGGVQYLHVGPFDEHTGTTLFSERIARNIQLLLKEEAHLKTVIDPAGGSWYVEELTNQLAEKAWRFFQKIEANGGILEVLKSNWLQQEIAEMYEKKNRDIQTRKQSIVGTNVYANLEEIVQDKRLSREQFNFPDGEKIEAVINRRLAEPYEEMRKIAKELEGKWGYKPALGMICLGELKQHKTRLDFMKGFLAAGGIQAVESKSIFSIDDARQFVSEQSSKHLCLCGTNEQYETIGHEILEAIRADFPERNIYLAGLPDKEKQARWLDEGINQFIHIKSNCYETLMSILSKLEVNTIEETKA